MKNKKEPKIYIFMKKKVESRKNTIIFNIGMIEDEYNNLNITNDIETAWKEFGETPKTEFSVYVETGGHRKIEYNGNKGKKTEETTSTTSKQEEEIVKESTSTSGGASSSGNVTTTGAEAATSVSTTAATVATTATTVAVVGATALVVVGGITNNAKGNFEYLKYTDGAIQYGLVLEGAGSDKFYIHCESGDYSVSKLIEYNEERPDMPEDDGSLYCWGSFDDILPNTEYHIFVKQADPSVKIIYDDKFVTTAEEPVLPVEPTFSSISFSKFDEETWSFDVTLDYSDPDSQIQSINLILNYDMQDDDPVGSDFPEGFDPEIYPLSLTTDSQTVLTSGDGKESRFVYPGNPLTYEVQYYVAGDENPKTALTGKITLEAKELPLPTFDSITFGKFVEDTMTFTVKLDYSDPSSRIESINLLLNYDMKNGDVTGTDLPEEEGFETEVYPLEVTTEVQEVLTNGEGRESRFVYPGNPLTYEVQYILYGDQTPITALSGNITLEAEVPPTPQDPEFYSIEFGKYDEELWYFTATVDYVDPDERIETLVLVFNYNSQDEQYEQEVYPLALNTEAQKIVTNGDGMESMFVYPGNPLTYEVIYYVYGDETPITALSGNITLEAEEKPFVEPTFVSVTFGEYYDFNENYFTLTLDYEDESEVIDDFRLVLTDGNISETYQLEVTTEEQIVYTTDTYINFDNNEVQYLISYKLKNSETYVDASSSVTTFKRQDYVNDLIWSKKANFLNYSFDVQLDYSDFSGERFDNFKLTLMSKGENPDLYYEVEGQTNDHSQTFVLEKTTETQTLVVEDLNVIDIVRDTFNYVFTYEDQGIEIQQEAGEIEFENSLNSNFIGVDLDGKVVQPVGTTDTFMPIRLNYIDEAQMYSSFSITFNGEEEYTCYLHDTNTYQHAPISSFIAAHENDEVSIFGQTLTYEIKAYVFNPKELEQEEETVLYSGTIELEIANAYTNVYGLYIESFTLFTYNYYINVAPVFLDTDNVLNLESFVMIIEEADGTRFSFAIDPLSNIYADYYMVSLEENEDLINYLSSGNPVDIYLDYTYGDSTNDEILIVSGIIFTILQGA